MNKVTVITKNTEVITLKTGSRGPQGIQGPKGDQGDVTLAQLNTKVDKLMATNLVTNGDFSNGTTRWFGSNGGLNVLNNTLQATGNGTNLSISIREDRVATILQNGRKEYARVRMRVRDNQAQLIRMRLYGGHSDTTINTPIQDWWYEVSAIITGNPSTETTPLFRFQLTSTYADSATANGKVLGIERPLIIDLTATFGAGNEPTKEQMDKLLSVYPNSWFNGTSEIGSIGALMRASLGGQVVTPTLLNSRTGTAQYVFSNDGLVIFRGTASGGSLNTNIFVLPENIRPIATRVFPISANNAFGVITVAANGEVRQTVGALTNVFLDGIVFKVGV